MPNTTVTEKLSAAVDSLYPEIVAFREDLHQHPELSWAEFETTCKIEHKLRAHGIDRISKPLDTGLVVDFEFHEGAPYIMLRADIDALPIEDEKSGKHYQSQNPGVCHACGHDGHTSIVLATALALHKSGITLPHNVRFVFQPAEEPTESGAPRMIAAGVLKDVVMALGMHLEPRLPLGTIGLADGYVNMQSNRIDMTLHGSGGHSARPAETADLLWVASRIIQDSYGMIYRGIDQRDSPVILTFTEISAGQGYNIIPKTLDMTGTLRFADPQKEETFSKRFKPYLQHLAAENRCEIDFRMKTGAPAIFNDPALTSAMIQNLEASFWLEVSTNTIFRTPGGDDFSYYLAHVPGAMMRIGVQTPETQASLHEGGFDIPAHSLKIGAAFFLHQLVHLTVR